MGGGGNRGSERGRACLSSHSKRGGGRESRRQVCRPRGPAPDGRPCNYRHGRHARTRCSGSSSGPGPSRGPLGSGRASRCTIVLTLIGIWKQPQSCPCLLVMELVAEKALVWGKGYFLPRGRGAWLFCWGECRIVGQRDPTQVTAPEEATRPPARLPGAGRLGRAQGVGSRAHRGSWGGGWPPVATGGP